ncbi:hypothetical protein Tco_0485131 [Tanacetum coccineum]
MGTHRWIFRLCASIYIGLTLRTANLVSDIATGMSHIVTDDQCKKHVGHDGALISSDKCSFWNVEKEAQLNHYPSVLAANGLSTVPKVASDIDPTPSTVNALIRKFIQSKE